MTQLWRIHIRPIGPEGNVDVNESVNLCLKQKVIGIGWRVDKKPSSKEDYMTLAEEKYGNTSWRSNANAILYKMELDDLVWFRDKKGIYYLGRIIGDWEYRDTEENLRTDIINVRPVEIYKVSTRVAGKIINSFIPRRTVQRINDPTSLYFSKLVYNKLSGKNFYEENVEENVDLFSLLSPEDIEDVVGIYLQITRGYFLIPSSRRRKNDTISYEYELVNKRGEKAFVQVKSGNVTINPDDYKDSSEGKYFLFSPAGYNYDVKNKSVETLSRNDIEGFLREYEDIMPFNIKVWIDYIKHL